MPAQPLRVPQRVWLWSLSEDVLVEVAPEGDQLLAFTQWGEVRFDDAGPVVRESLQRMSLGPVALENLPVRRSGPEPWQQLLLVLELLGNCVVVSLRLDDQPVPLLSAVPVSRRARFLAASKVHPDALVQLSRFACIRPGRDELLLESPLANHRALLHRPLAAWVAGALCRPTTVADVAAQLHAAEQVVADIVGLLVGCGLVLAGEAGQRPRLAEDIDPSLIPWSHHDLVFHASSRRGLHNGPAGAVFPLLDRLPAPPVVRPLPGPRIRLERPDMSGLAEHDPSLIDVMETRERRQVYTAAALTARQLGELLYRAARVRSTGHLPSSIGGALLASDRPYLSTSSLYELELYVSVDRCAGLPRGIFHYDPLGHALKLVNNSESTLVELLDNAKVAAGRTLRPAVLVSVTSRVGRVSWMYTGIAYATTLVHVGMLAQTFSIVATAMGIVACPLVLSDGVTTDDALRLAWPAEVSVGEFAIGA
jgi:SagB-type dehydrogenase family enzyme